MPVTNDPWGQNFNNFKNDFRDNTPIGASIPEFSMLNAQQMKNLIDHTNAHYIVVYNTMVAQPAGTFPIAVTLAAQADGTLYTGQYIWAKHNCPPDCDKYSLVDNANLRK